MEQITMKEKIEDWGIEIESIITEETLNEFKELRKKDEKLLGTQSTNIEIKLKSGKIIKSIVALLINYLIYFIVSTILVQ